MEKIYEVDNMKCDGCAKNVTEKFSDVSGVEAVKVDLETNKVTVVGDVKKEALAKSLADTPYVLK